jgi:hypothetical protein
MDDFGYDGSFDIAQNKGKVLMGSIGIAVVLGLIISLIVYFTVYKKKENMQMYPANINNVRMSGGQFYPKAGYMI